MTWQVRAVYEEFYALLADGTEMITKQEATGGEPLEELNNEECTEGQV